MPAAIAYRGVVESVVKTNNYDTENRSSGLVFCPTFCPNKKWVVGRGRDRAFTRFFATVRMTKGNGLALAVFAAFAGFTGVSFTAFAIFAVRTIFFATTVAAFFRIAWEGELA